MVIKKETNVMTPKMHVALNVNNLEESLAFYRALWGVEPVKVRRGYAKFDVAEPGVNLTLNENPVREAGGLNHLGVQVGSAEAVTEMQKRWEERGLTIALEEKQTSCCYAIQDKAWVVDPNGYRWEVFVVLEDNLPEVSEPTVAACCVPPQPEMVRMGDLRR
jgi:catechol 2,3-dioxygenase-like lactoylglutathione lyase family enzyme